MKLLFSNQKGGVGKTTLSRELGVWWAVTGKKVLLVDCDAQGNLSKSLSDQAGPGLYEALESGQAQPFPVRENLWLLAGDVRLASLEKRLIGEVDAYTKLAGVLDPINDQYDIIILDTPPSLGVMTINALACADCLVIPLVAAQYALQGTNDLMTTVNKVRQSLNPSLKLAGVALGIFDSLPIISRQLKEEVERAFGELCLKSVLAKTIKYEEAISLQKGLSELEGPIWKKSQSDIESLGKELSGRLGLEL